MFCIIIIYFLIKLLTKYHCNKLTKLYIYMIYLDYEQSEVFMFLALMFVIITDKNGNIKTKYGMFQNNSN